MHDSLLLITGVIALVCACFTLLFDYTALQRLMVFCACAVVLGCNLVSAVRHTERLGEEPGHATPTLSTITHTW